MVPSVRAIYKIFNFTGDIYSPFVPFERTSAPDGLGPYRDRPLLFAQGERPGGDEVITWGS
jgi:hypothetical protein